MSLLDFIFGKIKNNNIKNDELVNKPFVLKNQNIVYPKNTQEEEIKQLYSEIKNYVPKKHNLDNKYTVNIIIKNQKSII